MINAHGAADIVIVEDDEDLSYLLKILFEHAGFNTLALFDGYACAQYIRDTAPPRVVVMNMMLPYRNGFQLLEQMREHARWQAASVIMLSLYNDDRDVARARALRADYLMKPFVPAELLASVRRHLPQAATLAAVEP